MFFLNIYFLHALSFVKIVFVSILKIIKNGE